MRALLVLTLLVGCAATPTTPERACADQVNRDPVVHELMLKGAGVEEFRQNHIEDMNMARARALRECLGGRGLIRPGGVEARRPTT